MDDINEICRERAPLSWLFEPTDPGLPDLVAAAHRSAPGTDGDHRPAVTG